MKMKENKEKEREDIFFLNQYEKRGVNNKKKI